MNEYKFLPTVLILITKTRNNMLKSKISVGSRYLFVSLLLVLLLPYQVFSYGSSSGEFKKYLLLLEEKFSNYGWKDLHPREIPWEYYRVTNKKIPLAFVSFGDSSKNCILFFGGVHGDELPSVYLMFKLANYVKEILLDSRTTNRPYLNKKYLIEIVHGHTKGYRNHTMEITKMLTLELMQRLLIEQ